MGRPLSPEAQAKKEALANRTTEQVFQDAVKRGLESDVAAERVAAIKAYADEHNPNLTEMKDKMKQAEDRAAKAEASLAAVVAERDTAQAILVIAMQSALQGTSAKAELAALKTDFDVRIADARKELVAESQEHEWKAARAENAATEKLQDAQRQFGARGQQILLDEVKRIFEENHVSEPEDLTKLPAGISPLYLTLFGHSAVRAQLMLGYSKSFPSATEDFKNTLLRCLKAQLPVYEGAPQSDPIDHLQDKIDVLRSLGKKWPGVLEEVGRQVEEAQIQRQATFLRNHYAQMQSQSNDAALRGEGRSPIGETEPVSITGYTGPHDPLCVCKICSPNLRRPGSLDALDNVENF